MTRYSVYLVKCTDGTYYAGIAINVQARLKQHDAGRGAKYVRGRTPVKLIYSRRCSSLGAALRRERAIKRLTRKEKEQLVRSAGSEK